MILCDADFRAGRLHYACSTAEKLKRADVSLYFLFFYEYPEQYVYAVCFSRSWVIYAGCL